MKNEISFPKVIHAVSYSKTLLVFFFLTFSSVAFSQTSNVSSFNETPERVVGYQNSDFKFDASAFSTSNQYLFGQLSVEERTAIEAEIEPKAVGVRHGPTVDTV